MKWPLCLLLFLTACNREEQPQAPTQAESERLDDAESMLNGIGYGNSSRYSRPLRA